MDTKGFEKKTWFPYLKNMYDEVGGNITEVDAKGYEEKPWWPYVLDLQEKIDAGGGGSSDFSIAHVTLIEIGGGRQSTAIETVLIEDNDNFIFGEARADNGETIIANVVLYKGRSILTFVSYGTVQEITGDIEESGKGYIITGDCTIRAFGDKDV